MFSSPAELGVPMSHLALAWLAIKPTTSTIILGASKPEQILDNLKALEVIPKLTPAVLEKIETILDNKPEPRVSAIDSSILSLNMTHFAIYSPPLGDQNYKVLFLNFSFVINMYSSRNQM